ncbi:hypothetical protein [Streptomyces sp. BE303]|nr:hypothetical protein [Streptomyces sp. BE303]
MADPGPACRRARAGRRADTELAKVIPLGLFDPLANPWRRP